MRPICPARRYVVPTLFQSLTLIFVQGISLTVDQYKALVKAIPEISASLKASGIAVDESTAMDEDDEVADEKPKKRKAAAKKDKKANIDETSDEE